MSGPTGFEPGGARTLVKVAEYVTENVPPGNFPSPAGTLPPFNPSPEGPPQAIFDYTFIQLPDVYLAVLTPSWGTPQLTVIPVQGGFITI